MTPRGYVLLASLAANVALGAVWLNARDDVAAGAVQLENAAGAANACSDATEDLRTMADKRKVEAAGARAAAAGAALTHDKRADHTLGQQPKDAANSCASIQALGDDWLASRMLPK